MDKESTLGWQCSNLVQLVCEDLVRGTASMLYGVRQVGLSVILRRYIVGSVIREHGLLRLRDPFSVVRNLEILIGSL